MISWMDSARANRIARYTILFRKTVFLMSKEIVVDIKFSFLSSNPVGGRNNRTRHRMEGRITDILDPYIVSVYSYHRKNRIEIFLNY